MTVILEVRENIKLENKTSVSPPLATSNLPDATV